MYWYKNLVSFLYLTDITTHTFCEALHSPHQQVINGLGGGHTHTYRHENQSNFKKPGMPGLKIYHYGQVFL